MNDKLPGYARYWAKTAEGQTHRLMHHSLDVAACAFVLVQNDANLRRTLASALECSEDEAVSLVAWLASLHDFGKFHAGFQQLSPSAVEQLGGALGPKCCYSPRHDAAGLWLLTKQLSPWRDVPDPDDSPLLCVANAVAGHHGVPVDQAMSESEIDAEAGFAPAHLAHALRLAEDLAALFDVAGSALAPLLRAPRGVPERLSWRLAGLLVVADWLGSNADWFPMRFDTAQDLPLDAYWAGVALPGAQSAVHQAGLSSAPWSTVRGLSALASFTYKPRPLQAFVDGVQLPPGPTLVCIEDSTGSGKTEAAIAIAHRIAAEEGLSRIFFALPTTATANGLYARVATDFAGLFEAAAAPSLVLAHGAASRNTLFSDTVTATPGVSGNAGAAECAQWLASNRKASILASFGVGTIDQALLAVLRLRHQSIRLNALAGAVLIVDEVHACDAWMNTLLCKLLSAVSELGGSVVLCSATLPKQTREQLERSFAGPAFEPVPAADAAAYPLVTLTARGGQSQATAISAHAPVKLLSLAHHHDEESVIRELVTSARSNQCAAWIRNTVGQAIVAYTTLVGELGPEHVTLFHSRFTAGDRRRIEESVLSRFGAKSGAAERAGHVVVATQVIEQSLDLDFDVLITDLAPIDLVVQRAGRLRRHARSASGDRLAVGLTDERGAATLHVFGPEFTETPRQNWYGAVLGNAQYVYPDAGKLWRTSRALTRRRHLRLPTELRALIEQVYADTNDVPNALLIPTKTEQAKTAVERSLASGQTIHVEDGYMASYDDWTNTALSVTRLGEPTIVIRLATAVDGTPVPIEASPADAELRVKHRWIAESELEGGAAAEPKRRDKGFCPGGAPTPTLVMHREADGSLRTVVADSKGDLWEIRYGSDLGFERVRQ